MASLSKMAAIVIVCCMILVVSTAEGRWTSTKLVSEESGHKSLKPSLDVGPDGAVHVVWYDDDGEFDQWNVFYRKGTRADCWRGWFFKWSTTEILTTGSHRLCKFPRVRASSDGTVHVVWSDSDRRIEYMHYQGETGWSTAETAAPRSWGDIATDPALGVGPDGIVHIAWRQRSPNVAVGDIFYSYRDPETGWTEPEVVSEYATGDCYSPSLDVGDDGTVHLAWEGSGEDWSIFHRRKDASGEWSTIEIVSTETDDHPVDVSLAVGPHGIAHVAWSEMSEYGESGRDWDVFYKRCDESEGWSTTEVVSTVGTGVSVSPSLAVGSDGVVCIAWYDDGGYAGSGNDSDIFMRQYEAEGGWSETRVISDESTGNSAHPSVGVAPDGTIHVVWQDQSDLCGSGEDQDIFYRGSETPPYCVVVLVIAIAVLILIPVIMRGRGGGSGE